MINRIFNFVAQSLHQFARATGFTYNQINILVYYFFIPFTWLMMLDGIFGVHYLKLGFGVFCFGFWVGCRDFRSYADWAFYKSVDFLNYFNRFGSNYYKSSVWICVAVPVFIYVLLIYFTITK